MKIDVERMAAEIMSAPLRKWKNRRFSTLGQLQPEDQDPDVIFKNNWLANGQAFGLVAGSGIGKSSMSVQAAYHWAIGETFLATPMKPLNIAIIQAEDSDRDLKEQREGITRGLYEFEGWTPEQIDAADSRIVIPNEFIGRSGEEFLNLLRDFQGDTHQDLIIINPLQSFFSGDVSSQEDAYVFANGIDSIIKDESLKCVCGIVMHTAKWTSGKKDGRQDVSDYGEYMMAGSHAWTDWLRAIFAFQKHGASEEYFDFRATKRGTRLGWKTPEGEKTKTKIFKHSDGFIYWQEVTDADEIAAIPMPVKQIGSPGKATLDIKNSARECSNHHADECRNKDRASFSEYFWNLTSRKNAKSQWGLVFDELVLNCSEYGFRKITIKAGNKKDVEVLV